jgi:peroxiredoxin
LDLPKYESLNTQVLGVSTDVVEALHAFAEELRLTYPLLSDFSRETVKRYGVMVADPHAASFRLAQRAYVIIDRHGIIRYKQVMDNPDHALESAEIFTTVQQIMGRGPVIPHTKS